MAGSVHYAQERLRVARVVLWPEPGHPLRPRPVFAHNVAGVELHSREARLMEEVAVRVGFATVHIHSAQDHTMAAGGHDQSGFILRSLRRQAFSVVSPRRPQRRSTAVTRLKKNIVPMSRSERNWSGRGIIWETRNLLYLGIRL